LNEIPLGALSGALVLCILCSAFFAGAETALMSLNRYRLRHLARHKGHHGAQRASRLLERPDRLLGLILLGNLLVNNLAASIATIIALRLFGEAWIAIAVGVVTLLTLIFSEVAPKTFAALHPEQVAFPASWVLEPLGKIVFPVVAAVNLIANGILRLFGQKPGPAASPQLSREELRTVVAEATPMISQRHRQMLTSILDLEKVTVDDIMVPRNEIHGIDLDDPPEAIRAQLLASEHTRMPLFRGEIGEIVGMLHLRRLLSPLSSEHFDPAVLVNTPGNPISYPKGRRSTFNSAISRRSTSGSGWWSTSMGISRDWLRWTICSKKSSANSPPIPPTPAPTSSRNRMAATLSKAAPTCVNSTATCAGSCRPTAPRPSMAWCSNTLKPSLGPAPPC